MARYHVYTLAYPDGTVFYVGKGQGKRSEQHIIEAKQWTCQCEKCRVIQSIIFKGKKVKISYVFESDDQNLCFQRESELIKLLAPQGRLVNKALNPQGSIVPPAPLYQSVDEFAAWVRRNMHDPRAQRREIREFIKHRIRALQETIHRSMPRPQKELLWQEISELKQMIGDGWQRSFDLLEDADPEWLILVGSDLHGIG